MEIETIHTDKHHRAALAEIEGAPDGTEQGDRLDVLVALVEIYEARRWPLNIDKSFDPIDLLNYAIEEATARPNWPSCSARAPALRKFSHAGEHSLST